MISRFFKIQNNIFCLICYIVLFCHVYAACSRSRILTVTLNTPCRLSNSSFACVTASVTINTFQCCGNYCFHLLINGENTLSAFYYQILTDLRPTFVPLITHITHMPYKVGPSVIDCCIL